MDIARLFSVLSKANTVAQQLTEPDLEISEQVDLLVRRVSLNSPLTMELIATGLGTIYLFIQIIDRGGKFLLEREKLKLEAIKLKSELEKKDESPTNNPKIEEILSEFDSIKLKLKSLKVDRFDGEKS
ncbi:hypothetical protein KUL49_18430 [Alteromonas sp. KUL17]|uniref:hypothetical protein n=1 Tax=Alteromonas sp. KUL17 TaxID=2480796 RepID=UPI001037112E|nr:hypothetical protein [Alteromonas sp. KUL17]TAP20663.1 hypothetical protein KUL49_18430 [Alteromonas sp. KUL17]